FHQLPIEVWPDLFLKVLSKRRLDFACNLQRNSGALRNVNGNVSSLYRSDPSDEAEILLFVFDQVIVVQVNSVMDGTQFGQGFLLSLIVTDRYILNVRIVGIVLAKAGIMWPV